MSPYEKAMQIIAAEHEIVQTIYMYIDRMNDPDDINDPLIKSTNELLIDLEPVIKKHLRLLWVSNNLDK